MTEIKMNYKEIKNVGVEGWQVEEAALQKIRSVMWRQISEGLPGFREKKNEEMKTIKDDMIAMKSGEMRSNLRIIEILD